MIYFTRDPSNTFVAAHRDGGGRVVLVRGDGIRMAEGDRERVLCPLGDVSLPLEGHFDFHIENVLATVAAAWAYGLADEAIAEGLHSFDGEK